MSEQSPVVNYLTVNNGRHLQADCENCFGLCCVALAFAASTDFAMDKAAGQPCTNLQSDFRCGVHNNLRQQGLRGCTVFDCLGAGQQVSQKTYAGQDWHQDTKIAKQMFEVFPVMKELHELLWYLTDALTFSLARPIQQELNEALIETLRLTELEPELIILLDLNTHRIKVNQLLLGTSEIVRTEALQSLKGTNGGRRKSYNRGADLIGAKLKGADLRGVNFRGAYLIASDLREADLRSADLIGADFRDSDLSGADLTRSMFLTQAQVNSAKGDSSTKLPLRLIHPPHWTGC
ncbi:oxetanocin A resistance protein [Paenibacillus swuensis]|uniref:Oxetanocin A resistance protein n=1 Tax=Paenibacillus swuensis TaxID=1178515 RepID=A0A172TLJ1_9BACL|nr:pentapeptide repeat-containing protein [Paenibacillus swuensis]ANE47836.1 oxetanocin A resistance protein [Paenibacillus swuensis]